MRYAEYEINVEKLRLKRVARLGKEAEEGDDGEVDGSAAAADETGAKKTSPKAAEYHHMQAHAEYFSSLSEEPKIP